LLRVAGRFALIEPGDAQFAHRGRDRRIRIRHQFLEQFLPGAQARELDRDLVGVCPDIRIRSRARSTIFTGSPMSSTSTWPLSPMAAACSTSRAASGSS